MCFYICIINIHSTHTYIMQTKTFILDAIHWFDSTNIHIKVDYDKSVDCVPCVPSYSCLAGRCCVSRHDGWDMITHLNSILNMLATSRTMHTYVENPSAFWVLRMSLYWGMYGTTPPNMMATDAIQDTTCWATYMWSIITSSIFEWCSCPL